MSAAAILIVDDVDRNVRLLAGILAARGFRTRTADSGEAALRCIAADPPDLVLLDVMMPGMNGYDCLLYTSPSPRDGLLSRMPSSA